MTSLIRSLFGYNKVNTNDENKEQYPLFVGDLRFYGKTFEPVTSGDTHLFTVNYSDLTRSATENTFLCLRSVYLVFDTEVDRRTIKSITYNNYQVHPILCKHVLHEGKSIFKIEYSAYALAWCDDNTHVPMILEVVAKYKPHLFIEYTQCMDHNVYAAHVLYKNNTVNMKWIDIPVARKMKKDAGGMWRYTMILEEKKSKEATQVMSGFIVAADGVKCIRVKDSDDNVLYELPGNIARYRYEDNPLFHDIENGHTMDFDMLTISKYKEGDRKKIPYGINVNNIVRAGKKVTIEVERLGGDADDDVNVIMLISAQRNKLNVFF